MAKASKKAPDAKANAKGETKPKKRGKLGFYTTLLIMMVAAPFMFPTVVLLMAGLIPTIVAFCVDKDREHSSATAIGAMNCAGLTPFVVDLWVKGQTMGNAFHILTEPGNWLIILGSAAIGQMIVSVVPQAMATLTLAHSEMRVKNLKNNLELLKKSWGPDVGTTKPVDQVIRS
jgi:hypothetical protein